MRRGEKDCQGGHGQETRGSVVLDLLGGWISLRFPCPLTSRSSQPTARQESCHSNGRRVGSKDVQIRKRIYEARGSIAVRKMPCEESKTEMKRQYLHESVV
jgi:hypothetical protein